MEIKPSISGNHSLCNFITDGILIIGKDLKIVFANNAFLKWCGMPEDKVLGAKCHEISHKSPSPCNVICPHEEVFSKKEAVKVTHQHKCPDGKERFFEINASPVLDEKGEVAQMVEILRDVTEREKAEDDLKKTSEFFHTIIDSLAEGVLVIDRDMRISMVNKGYLDQLRLEDAIGMHCYKLSHGLDRPCYEEGEPCPVHEVFETGKPAKALHIHTDKNGNKVYVSIGAHPIKDSSGSVVQVVETINDVTERKKAEIELKLRVKELEEFYDMAVGRELKMMGLKDEIERLKNLVGKHGTKVDEKNI
ncbi:MAG: PAS domain-containing protein [Thermodesulfovibrionales bacterium]|nr:PAS domain-containing protein [Thermodesulfovibrionales bacterium]